MKAIKIALFSVFALLLPNCLYAKKCVTISSAEELAKLSNIKAGTEIIWRNGCYNDKILTIKASGTEKHPIIFRAETDGSVRFTGKSSLRIRGSHIIIRGFVWENPALEKGVVVAFDRTSSHSILEECLITGEQSEMRPKNNIKWVSLWGYKNCVRHCSFFDKRDLGQILIVRLEENDKTPQHIVQNCHFTRANSLRNEQGNRINGQCCIRFGTSNVAHQKAECIVENCLFEYCNGEGEIISSKSCGNIFRNNLFYESKGSLTLRHGDNSQVLNNFFIGNKQPHTAGIRIIGEGHIVKGNYLCELAGGNSRRPHCAIHLLQGQKNAPAGGYHQVKNVTVSENTIINCRYGITANSQREGCDLPVLNSIIERNTIVTEDNNCSVASEDAPHQIIWHNNTIFGGRQVGLSLAEVAQKPKLPEVEPTISRIRKDAGARFMK